MFGRKLGPFGVLKNKSGILTQLVSWTTKYTLIMKISNLQALINTILSNVQAHKFRGRSPVSNLTRLVSGLGRGNWHSLCASHCQMSNVLKED